MFFWDFGPSSPAGGPGQTTMFATNCDSLQVYVNGQYITNATPDAQAYPGLAHPPVIVDLSNADVTGNPELVVNGYVGGQPVATLPGPRMLLDAAREAVAEVLGCRADELVFTGSGTSAAH